ncbi:MAG: glycosyltransferase family 39 protein [Silvibacterium sp.]|nr:glycosyltransferase family 39 protein [Silvibacterium sp.]
MLRSITMLRTSFDQKPVRYLPWVCALLTVFCILAALPFGNVAFGDDWSYSATANSVAQTGHFRFTGWSTPSLGIDAYWAAFLIRIFGYSYQVTRLSTLPFAGGCALLLFALGRRFGLSPSWCAFLTLALMLNPVMIPTGATFLTDVPGLFFLLLTFYGLVRALQTQKWEQAVGWLAVATLAGAMGGTIRQLVFFGAFASLPAIVLVRRRDFRVAGSALVLWLALCWWMKVFVHWFMVQPNTENTPMSTLAHDWIHGPVWSVYSLFIFLFTGAEFALPLAVFGLVTRRKPPLWFWAAMAVVTAGSLLCLKHLQHDWNVVPYGNVLSYFGIFEGNYLLGGRPRSAPYVVFLVFTLMTFVAWGLFAWELLPAADEWRNGSPERWNRIKAFLAGKAGQLSTGEIWAAVFIPYYAIYIWVIWARVAGTIFFDRYPIPLLPGVFLGSLYLLQKRQGPKGMPPFRIPTLAWAMVAVFGLYGICISHDFFALLRAEKQAAETLQKLGIPRNKISAGFEYDATTQSNAEFYMVRKAAAVQDDRLVKLHWYIRMLPVVQPRYFVVGSDVDGLKETVYPATRYETWLPPFHRELKVEELNQTGPGPADTSTAANSSQTREVTSQN